MTDFPQGRLPVLDAAPGGVITSFGPMSLTGQAMQIAGATGGAGTWPLANFATYMQVVVPETVTVYQMSFEVTTTGGNYDIGIYDEPGTRLVSLGSTAVPAAGLAVANITDTVLTPGVYWLALVLSLATAAVTRSNTLSGTMLNAHGVMTQAAALPLPATATFGVPSTSYLPWVAAHLSSATV